jgi:hypothetical protein
MEAGVNGGVSGGVGGVDDQDVTTFSSARILVQYTKFKYILLLESKIHKLAPDQH